MLFIRPAREVAAIEAAHGEALALLDWDDARLFRVVERISLWSPAQHACHIALVNEGALGKVEEILEGPTAVDGASGLNLSGWIVLGLRRLPRGRAKSPPSTVPPGAPTREDARVALDRSLARAHGLAAKLDAVSSARGRARHFALGWLTAAQWLRMARVHARHHLAIVGEIAGVEARQG